MTKQEKASYLVSLITLLDSQDDAARPRSKALSEEYQRAYDEFKADLEEEATKRKGNEK